MGCSASKRTKRVTGKKDLKTKEGVLNKGALKKSRYAQNRKHQTRFVGKIEKSTTARLPLRYEDLPGPAERVHEASLGWQQKQTTLEPLATGKVGKTEKQLVFL